MMLFLFALLFSIGFSQTSFTYPPKATLVSDGDTFALKTSCTSTMVASTNATADNYWYCGVDVLGEESSAEAGLDANVYGTLAIEVPVNAEKTISFTFDSNVDDTLWGDDPDFAVLAEIYTPYDSANGFNFVTEAGTLHVTICEQATCNENTALLDEADWVSNDVNSILSNDVHDGDVGVASFCKPDKTKTYYVNFKNKGEDGVAQWYFYPVVDSDGECKLAADIAKIVGLILTIIGVTCGVCCCCACCIFCLCFGGMAMIMGNAAKDTQTIQTTTVTTA